MSADDDTVVAAPPATSDAAPDEAAFVKLALAPQHILRKPVSWRAPRMIFVNSMGDLFHEDAPDWWINRVFAVMRDSPQHSFQCLTKRARRMRDYILAWSAVADRIRRRHPNGHKLRWPFANVWLGVSVEDQRPAEERLPLLLETPASVRWASVEPLLEAVDLRAWLHPGGLDWVVVGGESGPGARPFDLAWAQHILKQCRVADVPCFIKQLGVRPVENGKPLRLRARAACACASSRQKPPNEKPIRGLTS